MPRGVRNQANYDEQIKVVDYKLEKYAKYVSELKERRQDLLAKKQHQTMNDLQAYMEKNHLEPNDVIVRLQSATASAESKSTEV